ncbi:MAG: MerR family transcriptional regulator [Candidatus Omnitrophica bacterium]|nr:MerR family transcriptional regulator [Candidatus Omnitrophota bacterium]
MSDMTRMTITEIAQKIGVTPKTIQRWERAGKIRKTKRDWRGWRVYDVTALTEIRSFYEGVY